MCVKIRKNVSLYLKPIHLSFTGHLSIPVTGATGNSILVYVTVGTLFVILFILGTLTVLSVTVYNIKKSRGSLE